MDFNYELLLVGRTVLAVVLGALVGLERELHGREAGIRTYATVALGACTFGLISSHVSPAVLDTRIAAGVVMGIGFLCAGTIVWNGLRISGLTTAASVWSTAAIGLAIAFGMYGLGITTALLQLLVLAVQYLAIWKKWKKRIRRLNNSPNN